MTPPSEQDPVASVGYPFQGVRKIVAGSAGGKPRHELPPIVRFVQLYPLEGILSRSHGAAARKGGRRGRRKRRGANGTPPPRPRASGLRASPADSAVTD